MKWALDKDLLREWMNCPLDGCTPRHRSLCEISVYRSPLGLPWWLLVKKAPVNAGDVGLISALGRSSGGGNGNPLQYSCLGKPIGTMSLESYSPWGHKESDMITH